jgi:hypothetical protein
VDHHHRVNHSLRDGVFLVGFYDIEYRRLPTTLSTRWKEVGSMNVAPRAYIFVMCVRVRGKKKKEQTASEGLRT